MNIVIKLMVYTLLSAMLAACNPPGPPPSAKKTDTAKSASLVAPAVTGLRYASLSAQGETDAQGTLSYQDGEEIAFYIGELFIGSTIGKPTISSLDLSTQQNSRAPEVINLSRLLLTLDQDNNSDNGVQISAEVAEAFDQNIALDWSGDIFTNDTLVQTLNALPNAAPIVSEQAALSVVEAQLESSAPELFFSVSGQIARLDASISLSISGGETLSLSPGQQEFAFSTRFVDGANFVLSVSQEGAQTCLLENASGRIDAADISNVSITCSNITQPERYSIGGRISDLNGLLRLTNSATQEVLDINANGVYTFAAREEQGASYNVTISAQPAGQICSFVDEQKKQGAIDGASVTDIDIDCDQIVVQTYSVSGRFEMIPAEPAGLAVQVTNNGANPITVSAQSPDFSFDGLTSGEAYRIALVNSSIPEGLSCELLPASALAGTISTRSINNLSLSCRVLRYPVTLNFAGDVEGLSLDYTLDGNAQPQASPSAGSSTLALGPFNYGSELGLSLNSPSGKSCTFRPNNTNTLTLNNLRAEQSIAVTCGNLASFRVTSVIENLTEGQTLTLNINGQSSTRGNGSEFVELFEGSQLSVSFSDIPNNYACSFKPGEAPQSPVTQAQTFTIQCSQETVKVAGQVVFEPPSSGAVELTFAGQAPLTYPNQSTANRFEFTVPKDSQFNLSETNPKYDCAIANAPITVDSDISDIEVLCKIQLLDVNVTVRGVNENDPSFSLTFSGISPNVFSSTDNISFKLPYDASFALESDNSDKYSCAILSANNTNIIDARTIDVQCDPLEFDVSVSVTGLNNVPLDLNINDISRPISEQATIVKVPYGSDLIVTGVAPPTYRCDNITRGISNVTQNQDYQIVCTGPYLDLSGVVDSNLRECINGGSNQTAVLLSEINQNLNCLGKGITSLQGIEILANTSVENLLVGNEDDNGVLETPNQLTNADIPYLYSLKQLAYLDISRQFRVDDSLVLGELERQLVNTNIKYAIIGARAESIFLFKVSFPEDYDPNNDGNIVVKFEGDFGPQRTIDYDIERVFHTNGNIDESMNIDLSNLSDRLQCDYLFEPVQGFPDQVPYSEKVELNCEVREITQEKFSLLLNTVGQLPESVGIEQVFRGANSFFDRGEIIKNLDLSSLERNGSKRFSLVNFKPTLLSIFDSLNEEGLTREFDKSLAITADSDCNISLDATSIGLNGGEYVYTAYCNSGVDISDVINDQGLLSCLRKSAGRKDNELLSIADIPADVDCSESGIRGLGGIQYATNIRNLDLSDNDLSDDDFDELSDPIYQLKNRLTFIDVGGNYDIRLSDNCSQIEFEFQNADTDRLNCAGPDRRLSVSVGVSSDVATYFTDFGSAYVRGLREHGRVEDTFDIELGPITNTNNSANFFPVRSGSSATLEFDSVRPSLSCSPDIQLSFVNDISRDVVCTAKSLVDLSATLNGGGYDGSGRAGEGTSGIELVYQDAFPFDTQDVSFVEGDTWFDSRFIEFLSFPAGEENVFVRAGANFNAPEGVYCTNSFKRTISPNSNAPFVLPCSQSSLLGQSLPRANESEAIQPNAPSRQYYALSVDSTASTNISFPVSFSGAASFTVSLPTADTDLATRSTGSLFSNQIQQNVDASTTSVGIAYDQAGQYIVSVQNKEATSANDFEFSVALDDEESSRATLKPIIETLTYTRSWGTTVGNSSDPGARLRDDYRTIIVQSSDGGSGLTSGALLRVELSSLTVDTYVLVTNDDSGEVLAVNDDAFTGTYNRSVAFLAVPPGRYRVYMSTYNAITSNEDLTLKIDSSMPAFTLFD